MPGEVLTLRGHLIDEGILKRALAEVDAGGGSARVLDLQVGEAPGNESTARLAVVAADDETLARLVERLEPLGATQENVGDARTAEADVDGALPPDFYSTTNLDTEVRVGGRWLQVENPEMDCGLVVDGGRARTVPMNEVTKGMTIVLRGPGIRVTPPPRPEDTAEGAFGFMSSDVSSEKPKALLVERVATAMQEVKASGRRIMWVAGPAVIHTGAGPDLSALIRAGYVDAFFAGNGVAAHDIESYMFGTSLGVHLSSGGAAEHGHEHHIRAVNELRRHGSFAAAIEAGVFGDGIVYNLVESGAAYLFGGSVRDDGPLPEVVTDMPTVQKRLRELIWGPEGDDVVGYCIVVGTMLHGIATGNCLPASVPLVCVDINQATVTKLMDRGSFQSVGIITDVGLFIRELAERLAGDELREPSADAKVREAASRTPR